MAFTALGSGAELGSAPWPPLVPSCTCVLPAAVCGQHDLSPDCPGGFSSTCAGWSPLSPSLTKATPLQVTQPDIILPAPDMPRGNQVGGNLPSGPPSANGISLPRCGCTLRGEQAWAQICAHCWLPSCTLTSPGSSREEAQVRRIWLSALPSLPPDSFPQVLGQKEWCFYFAFVPSTRELQVSGPC